jgi:hypothetical protein
MKRLVAALVVASLFVMGCGEKTKTGDKTKTDKTADVKTEKSKT